MNESALLSRRRIPGFFGSDLDGLAAARFWKRGARSMVLNDAILRRMDPKDRAALGKAGRTFAECEEQRLFNAEKDLQSEIRQDLNRREIEYINPDMRKRSALPVGWPDFTFVYLGIPLALEAKVQGRKPRPNQAEMHVKLRRNGWQVFVVESLADVLTILRDIDAGVNPRPGVVA